MWKVMVLKVGYISVDWGSFLGLSRRGEKRNLPVWITAATDGKHKVVIDTGIYDLTIVKAGPEPNYHQSVYERTENALRQGIGWDTKDVDIVINTHLHYDHCGGNYLFSNALFYVSRLEWEDAVNADKNKKGLYQMNCFWKKDGKRQGWQLIDGEQTLVKGLTLIPTPGHTRGQQSVLLNTKQGIVCVAGDSVAVLEQLYGNIVPESAALKTQVKASYARIRERADRIIPGHEYTLRDRSTKDFPEVYLNKEVIL